VDEDGKLEYITVANNKVLVFRDNYKESASIDIQWEGRSPKILICAIENGDEYPALHVQVGQNKYHFRYFKNRWVQYRGLVYPAIFILLFGLFFLWVIVQNRILGRRYEKDRLISSLQLQSIKNQLDPHFTYNALNAVGSLIYKGERDQAYQYLKGLTDLLRMVSGDSTEITWTLSQEMEFVLKYLEIEKLRFRDKFNYILKVEEDRLKTFRVPKMSILTFVENSIKHGLRHKEYDRKLEVSACSFEEGLKISVLDNGIGRAAAEKHREDSAGNGIEMMKEYFRQFSEATGKKARFRFEDLFEYDLKPAGTLVEITIK
jgi:anti-sigma regulatory factor (Ser/Thr protein kinase)